MVGRARAAEVAHIVAVGIDVVSSRRSAAIANEQGLCFSAGVHPNSAAEWSESAATDIEGLLDDPRAVAVGETGLDFYRNGAPADVQRRVFRDHIAIARNSGAALVIHTRASVTEAIDELEMAGPPARFVFHCWSGGDAELRRAIDLGAHISFAGNISFKNAEALRELAALVPEDRLLVETDSPFLAPVPHRGRANEPAFVPHVGAALAVARSMGANELARVTTRNARAFFRR